MSLEVELHAHLSGIVSRFGIGTVVDALIAVCRENAEHCHTDAWSAVWRRYATELTQATGRV